MAEYRVQKYRLQYVKETNRADIEQRTITHRRDVREFCNKYLQGPIEKVCCIALDTANRIIGFTVQDGSTNQCAVYPSMIFSFLLSTGASGFILAHNHPGGCCTPSEADWQITKRLKDLGMGLEIPILDHIIIPDREDTETVSMRELSRW